MHLETDLRERLGNSGSPDAQRSTPSWLFLGGPGATGAERRVTVAELRTPTLPSQNLPKPRSQQPCRAGPTSHCLSFVVDEIPMRTLLNASRAAYIWKLAFYVAHLEKNEDFLGTQVAIIKSPPRKRGQHLEFARKQELSYSF